MQQAISKYPKIQMNPWRKELSEITTDFITTSPQTQSASQINQKTTQASQIRETSAVDYEGYRSSDWELTQ